MKLIIQIPCYNEEHTLPMTLADLPKRIDGVDCIETQVIDDGSTDNTAEVARQLGVTHIIKFRQHRGLAAAFKAGVGNALGNRADILVNTDGDNQYCGMDIPLLVKPIIDGSSDVVIGCRPIDEHPEFSPLKKMLQRFGSWVLRKASNTNVKDAASGFRAYNQEALLHINIFSDFSYCMETLIQAGYHNLKVSSCDIRVNRKTRESRLFKHIGSYLVNSGKTITKIFILYRSGQFFTWISAVLFMAAMALAVRYIILVTFNSATGGLFWPSIVLAGALLMASFFVYLTGVLSDLLAANRKLSEEILFKLRKIELNTKKQLEPGSK